jgi:hypothetical protein
LMALVETHPGVSGTTGNESYIRALHDFIRVYVLLTDGVTMPNDHELHSRPAFRKWVLKITGVRKIDFTECTA